MSAPISIRAVVCEPEKGDRQRLCACLAANDLVEETIVAPVLTEAMTLLKKANVLFIDPLGLELAAASKFIFQARQNFPQVIICLLIRPGEVRRRAYEFYAGERERFGHYFKLNKELPGDRFEEEAYLLISHCFEAVRGLRLRSGRIQLTVNPRFMNLEAGAGRHFGTMPKHAKEPSSPAGMTAPLPAGSFTSSLPGLGRCLTTGHLSQ